MPRYKSARQTSRVFVAKLPAIERIEPNPIESLVISQLWPEGTHLYIACKPFIKAYLLAEAKRSLGSSDRPHHAGTALPVGSGRVGRVDRLSVAVKKGAILAPLAPGGPLPSRMSLSLLLGGVVQNGPERSRARRYWARRSGPLTARTVLGDWSKRERLSEELAKGGPKKWPLCPAPLTRRGDTFPRDFPQVDCWAFADGNRISQQKCRVPP
jgi:hypothetical protein